MIGFVGLWPGCGSFGQRPIEESARSISQGCPEIDRLRALAEFEHGAVGDINRLPNEARELVTVDVNGGDIDDRTEHRGHRERRPLVEVPYLEGCVVDLERRCRIVNPDGTVTWVFPDSSSPPS